MNLKKKKYKKMNKVRIILTYFTRSIQIDLLKINRMKIKYKMQAKITISKPSLGKDQDQIIEIKCKISKINCRNS